MGLREISLVKGAHRYIFRYSPGSEADVIGSFACLAEDLESDFDWFDAAVLSYQMGRQLDQDIEKVRPAV
ncbi:MAG: hypothetical protein GXY33_12575 [Phycisphaerae bacterium]|nr:hypothetical protein [Phycisphaerae bacterium]